MLHYCAVKKEVDLYGIKVLGTRNKPVANP